MTINENNMRQFAEFLSERNEGFKQDLNTFAASYLTEENRELMTYSPKGFEPVFYPNVGVIGYLGIQNTWFQPLETCVRYLLLEGAVQELSTVEQIRNDLYDRIQAGKELQSQNKLNAEAIESLAKMGVKLAILTAGIELVSDMIMKKASLPSTLEKENEVAERWIELYA